MGIRHFAMLPPQDGPTWEKREHGQLLTAPNPFARTSYTATTQLQERMTKVEKALYHMIRITISIIFPLIKKINSFL